MMTLIRLEELMLLALGFVLFLDTDLAWWWFLVLLLTPDIGMLGYVAGNKAGAFCYNVFHHRGLATLLYIVGKYVLQVEVFEVIGIILFSHAAMDRIFGYGLKYEKGFTFSHLGKIGKGHG